MARSRTTLLVAALALGTAAAVPTAAGALTNRYTGQQAPGILPFLLGEDGFDDEPFAYERPIRRPYRVYRHRGPDPWDDEVPPPYDDGY